MDTLHLDQHISRKFNAELEELRTQLLEMGGLVEQQIVDAVAAITSANVELADRVNHVEREVDAMELKLDEDCTLVLARRQPAASDLRMVLAVVKITRDLERIGDEAQKIAEMAQAFESEGEAPRGYVELRHIGSIVHGMVNDALNAFARFDTDLAIAVAQQDKTVDREYGSAMRELATYMMEDPRSISRVLNIIWALRSLERIGDHARNIAEHIVYLVKGKDVRHLVVADWDSRIKGN